MVWFADLSTYTDPSSVLVPHNSHLHGTTRVVYWVVMETVGTNYVVIRLLGVSTVLLCAGLFFALAKPRVGQTAALVLAVLLLFYGSAWQHVVGPIGFTVLLSVAAGLAALLAIEREDTRGDLMACALVCLSVFTFTVGLAFLVGIAISVLLRRDRVRRAWIFLIPLALYAAWWLWALQFDQGRTEAANLEHVPSFFAHSAAVTTGGLTGVNIPFSRFGEVGGVAEAPASFLGWIVAAAFAAALVWRFSRGNVPASLWVSLGVLSTYWLAGALADPLLFGTQADAVRYVYPGSIGVLLVATDLARGMRLPRGAAAALLGVAVFSLGMNLIFMRDGGAYLRSHSTTVQANMAMLELGATSSETDESGLVPRPDASPIPGFLGYGPDPEDYLASVDRYGSPAYTLDEIRADPVERGLAADQALADAYDLDLADAQAPRGRAGCTRAASGEPIPLPPGGARLSSPDGVPVPLTISRFSSRPAQSVGVVQPAGWSSLAIPTDPAPEPWRLLGPAETPLVVCPI